MNAEGLAVVRAALASTGGTVFFFLPFIVVAALGSGFWLVFRQRERMRREAAERRLVEPDLAAPPRDAPMSTARRRRFLRRRVKPPDPRTNGHSKPNGHGTLR